MKKEENTYASQESESQISLSNLGDQVMPSFDQPDVTDSNSQANISLGNHPQGGPAGSPGGVSKSVGFTPNSKQEKLLQGAHQLQTTSLLMKVIAVLILGKFAKDQKVESSHGSFTNDLATAMRERNIDVTSRTIHSYGVSWDQAIQNAPDLETEIASVQEHFENDGTAFNIPAKVSENIGVIVQKLDVKIPYLTIYKKSLEPLSESSKPLSKKEAEMVIVRQAINRHISSAIKGIEQNKKLKSELKKIFKTPIHSRSSIPQEVTIQQLEKFVELLKRNAEASGTDENTES